MFECAVCGSRTHDKVTLAALDEDVPICSRRCQRKFIHDPIRYLGALMGTQIPERSRELESEARS